MCSPSNASSLTRNLLSLTIVRPRTVDAPCADCDGRGYHHTERTMRDPAGEVDCGSCADGTVKVRACMGCFDAPATEGLLCEVCSGAVDVAVAA